MVDPNVLVGASTSDDAAVYRLNAEQAVVATVDYITPVVDDPFAFGAIAAANALSDVYAMGGRPLFALNLVGFPRDKLSLDVLSRIVDGGCHKVAEAGACVIGGHSIDDPEPKYGLVAVGLVHPDRVVRNVGARPGDQLVLTKPLGIGIITTAIKRDVAPPELVEAAVAAMATLNRAASEAMVEVGVHAATDVTGFGLLGHLTEMAGGSGVGARVHLERVPVLDGVWDLVRQGVAPGGSHRNRDFLAPNVTWEPGIAPEEQLVLCDAQTSGGLLMAVPPARLDALLAALDRRGVGTAAHIGEVLDHGGPLEVVRR